MFAPSSVERFDDDDGGLRPPLPPGVRAHGPTSRRRSFPRAPRRNGRRLEVSLSPAVLGDLRRQHARIRATAPVSAGIVPPGVLPARLRSRDRPRQRLRQSRGLQSRIQAGLRTDSVGVPQIARVGGLEHDVRASSRIDGESSSLA